MLNDLRYAFAPCWGVPASLRSPSSRSRWASGRTRPSSAWSTWRREFPSGHPRQVHCSTALPDEAAETTLRKETLKRILCALAPRERRVLELRYGLDGQHPRTLDEVGRTFNVTRERVRQIENQSLKKLQALAESQKLREVA